MPIDGQPKSIVKDLEDMARTYIKVRCFVLYLPADADCAHLGVIFWATMFAEKATIPSGVLFRHANLVASLV